MTGPYPTHVSIADAADLTGLRASTVRQAIADEKLPIATIAIELDDPDHRARSLAHPSTGAATERTATMTGRQRRSEQDRRLNAGIGHAIVLVRTDANLSQRELARRVGVDRSLVSRWEAGLRMPNLPDLVEIAGIGNLATSELVRRAEQWSPHMFLTDAAQ